MSRVTMFWHGGANYAVFDVHNREHAEVFDSIEAAKRAFEGRCNGRDRYYPCVSDKPQDEGGPTAWLFLHPFDKHPVVGAEYPDRILSFGPKGGLRMEHA